MTDLRWTKEVPTEPGWYWTRIPEGAFPEVVDFTGSMVQEVGSDCWSNVEDYHDYEWAGPIPEPKEAEE